MMKIALIYPPTCDPTAPYLSLPTLTGYLRAHGVEVWAGQNVQFRWSV